MDRHLGENERVVGTIVGDVIRVGRKSGHSLNAFHEIANQATGMHYYLMECADGHFTKVSFEDIDYVRSFGCSWYYWSCNKGTDGYIAGHYDGKCKYLHRTIMLNVEDAPSEKHSVDHINRDKMDNRRENLRWATQSEQNENTGKRTRKKTAKPLPDGITHDMLEKYVVYYRECYDKKNERYRDYFKVEKHPGLPKIWIGSKSNTVSLQDKLNAANAVAVAAVLSATPTIRTYSD